MVDTAASGQLGFLFPAKSLLGEESVNTTPAPELRESASPFKISVDAPPQPQSVLNQPVAPEPGPSDLRFLDRGSSIDTFA